MVHTLMCIRTFYYFLTAMQSIWKRTVSQHYWNAHSVQLDNKWIAKYNEIKLNIFHLHIFFQIIELAIMCSRLLRLNIQTFRYFQCCGNWSEFYNELNGVHLYVVSTEIQVKTRECYLGIKNLPVQTAYLPCKDCFTCHKPYCG